MFDVNTDTSTMKISKNPHAIETDHVIADDWSANWNGSVAVKITALIVWMTVCYSFFIGIILLNETTSDLKEGLNSQAEHIAHEIMSNSHYRNDNGRFNQDKLKRIVLEKKFLTARITYTDKKEWLGKSLSNEEIDKLEFITQRLSGHGSMHPEASIDLFHPPFEQLAQEEKITTLMVIVFSILGFGYAHVYITSRVLRRPLKALEEATIRVSNGDLAIRMDTHRQDEFGHLAAFFNEMLDRIQSDNNELKETLERLSELSRQKNRFMGVAAHDLRNPLSGTIGLCDCVLEGAIDISSEEEKENIFSTIKSTSHEMLTLVNDLLDTSVIENGTLVIRKDKTSLRDVLQKRIDIANYQAIKKEISIDLECENSLEVQLDAIRIGQVIDNLVGNAIKFSPKQSAIHVFAKRVGKTVEVSIQDQGPGIPEDEQSNIFDDFHTLSAKSTDSEKSTGLGMSIVKKIIDKHNGKIRISNNENKGATITFSLPAD